MSVDGRTTIRKRFYWCSGYVYCNSISCNIEIILFIYSI